MMMNLRGKLQVIWTVEFHTTTMSNFEDIDDDITVFLYCVSSAHIEYHHCKGSLSSS